MYIFISIPCNSVVRFFIDQGHGVTISGASTTKRHMLCQLDITLNAYLLAIFDMNPSQVAKYNAFYYIYKHDYLPRFYFAHKKYTKCTVEGKRYKKDNSKPDSFIEY